MSLLSPLAPRSAPWLWTSAPARSDDRGVNLSDSFANTLMIRCLGRAPTDEQVARHRLFVDAVIVDPQTRILKGRSDFADGANGETVRCEGQLRHDVGVADSDHRPYRQDAAHARVRRRPHRVRG